MADSGKHTGAEKVAVLLMALGEEVAADILSHMGPKEVQQVGVSMASMESVSKEIVESTLKEFIGALQKETGLGVGADDYVRNVLVSALGEEKAGGMIDRILLGGNTKGLESLKWMDARSVAELIRNEHPQIIAVVLSYLDSDQSAQIITQLPANTRHDIMMRIASVDGVQPSAMAELNEILESQLKGTNNVKSSAGFGGVKSAANILNFIDGTNSSSIMEKIKEMDEDLGDQIEDLMFVFADLVEIDDRGIQTMLRELQTDVLVLALKGAEPELQEKIFTNMSSRAADMLKDDLESKGPVKVSEVDEAQKEILVIARRLAEEGQISLGASAGGEEMI
jgi:flagellar motor switch protein FliG